MLFKALGITLICEVCTSTIHCIKRLKVLLFHSNCSYLCPLTDILTDTAITLPLAVHAHPQGSYNCHVVTISGHSR